MSKHILGDTADKNTLDSAAALGSHTDEINFFIFGLLNNELMRFTPHTNNCFAGDTGLVDFLFGLVQMLSDIFRHFFNQVRGDLHLLRVEIDDTDHENFTITNPPPG